MGELGLGIAGPCLGAEGCLIVLMRAAGHRPWDAIKHLRAQWWEQRRAAVRGFVLNIVQVF